MTQPTISLDQRDLAVALLANALRKDAHLWRGPAQAQNVGMAGGTTRSRIQASRSYAQGMIDLLAVLFDGGRPLANDCLNDAERLAFGSQES